MIKLTPRSWKRAKEEFDKGNRLWLAKLKINDKYKGEIEIKIIKSIKDHKKGEYMMTYTQWDKDNGYYNKVSSSQWESWNFKDYDFFVLNKKEAAPYLKEIMVDALIDTNEHKQQVLFV